MALVSTNTAGSAERGGGTNRPLSFIKMQGVKMHLLSETMLIDVCDSVTILRYGRQLS